MKYRKQLWRGVLLGCAIGTAPVTAAEHPSLQHLATHVPLVQEAYDILDRSGSPTEADLARSRELVAEFDRLLATRQRYLEWIEELQRAAAESPSEDRTLPTLTQLRDSQRGFLESLPAEFAGRQSIQAQVQQLNLAIAFARERKRDDDSAAQQAEALAQLFLHAGVFVRSAFTHFEVARAHLRQDILRTAVVREATAILAALDNQVMPLLQFNAAVVSDDRLTRSTSLVNGQLVGQVRSYGEYELAGERFDQRLHCNLAEFKASQALSDLAQRLGVVVTGEYRESCNQIGDAVGVWLAVPEANVVRFRWNG